eukprot:6984371-Ditylum_brightwellii.AAC.1
MHNMLHHSPLPQRPKPAPAFALSGLASALLNVCVICHTLVKTGVGLLWSIQTSTCCPLAYDIACVISILSVIQ